MYRNDGRRESGRTRDGPVDPGAAGCMQRGPCPLPHPSGAQQILGRCSPDRHNPPPCAADRCLHDDDPPCSSTTCRSHGSGPERDGSSSRRGIVGAEGGTAQQFPFVGDVEGSSPRISHAPRRLRGSESHLRSAGCRTRRPLQSRSKRWPAASRRIAQKHADRDMRQSSPPRGRSAERCPRIPVSNSSPSRTDMMAMRQGNRTVHKHPGRRDGPCPGRWSTPGGTIHARRVMNQSCLPFPLSTTFGVSVDERTPEAKGRPLHRLHHLPELLLASPSSIDEKCRGG